MVQLLHGRLDSEGVSALEKLLRFRSRFRIDPVDPDFAVDDDRPRVQLLLVVHDDGSGSLDHSENHHWNQAEKRNKNKGREMCSSIQNLT